MVRPTTLAAVLLTILSITMPATNALGLEARAVQMKEDFGSEPLYDCYMNYYYYIPCPTSSWFWLFEAWEGDKVGAWFQIGDVSMGAGQCDPVNCQKIDKFRVLDFAGYGVYNYYYVSFDIYCADANGCPVGPCLWSKLFETGLGWNYVLVNPPLSICSCATTAGPPGSRPRILITATIVGPWRGAALWAFDNISFHIRRSCTMHDAGCLPAVYPRPYVGPYPTMHSGYYGNGSFQYCPPRWFKDLGDTTPNATQYGYGELAWRIYLTCSGPSRTEPSTWGAIKAIYK